MSDGSRAVLDDLLARVSKVDNGAEAIAHLRASRAGNTRFARNRITSTGDHEQSELTLQIAFGKRHAAATTNQTHPSALDHLVATAIAMARVSPEDPEWMSALPPQTYVDVPAANDEATAKLGPNDRVRMVTKAIETARSEGIVGAGFLAHSGEVLSMASTSGLYARCSSSTANLTMTARTNDGKGSGWSGAENVRADFDAEALMHRAAEKAKRSQNARALDPGRYTVILEPAAVADLLNFLFQALDARRADEGRSFFSNKAGGTRLGEKVLGDATVRSDPFDPMTPTDPFDWDGLPLAPSTWVDKGTIAALSYSRFWASKKEKKPTGRHRSLHLLGGTTEKPEELLVGVKKGLLVTRFWYTRWVDPASLLVTGLTRDGVFLVEDGKIVSAVNNFRFNESPAVMLRNADGMTRGTQRVPLGWDFTVRVPHLRTHEFNMASVSAAV